MSKDFPNLVIIVVVLQSLDDAILLLLDVIVETCDRLWLSRNSFVFRWIRQGSSSLLSLSDEGICLFFALNFVRWLIVVLLCVLSLQCWFYT